MRRRHVPALVLACAALTGCGDHRPISPAILALQREARPIGRGPRYVSRARGPIVGRCRRSLGPRFAVHVEVFARNRVVLIPAGIGVAAPLRRRAGRIAAARCYGSAVTLDPTGVVLVRPGSRVTLGSVFRGWGVPLSRDRLAGFSAPGRAHVRAYVDGAGDPTDPPTIPLVSHAEIVVEVGPYVPPHHQYTFPATG